MVEERPTLSHMGIMNPQAVALFRQVYRNHVNPMTPRIWSRRMIAAGRLAVELSSGEWIGEPIWGVTVLVVGDLDNESELSECFDDRAAAESYIEKLRDWRAGDPKPTLAEATPA